MMIFLIIVLHRESDLATSYYNIFLFQRTTYKILLNVTLFNSSDVLEIGYNFEICNLCDADEKIQLRHN